MALTACRECAKDVSTEAPTCPHCGVPQPGIARAVSASDFPGLDDYYRREFTKIYETNESYKGKWNWAAFFFGPVWALTKGVWLAPIVCAVAALVTGGIGGIVYAFIFGARGNYMYYCAHAKNKQAAI